MSALASQQRVAGIFAGERSGEHYIVLQQGREILEAVDRDIHFARKQGAIDFLREKRAATDSPQRHVRPNISLGANVHQLDRRSSGLRADQSGHMFCLPQSQGGGAGPDSQSACGAHGSPSIKKR